MGGIVDKLCIVKSCTTELFNHAPAKLFMNTGTGQFGRPSMGSWVSYGLGSECRDLPAGPVYEFSIYHLLELDDPVQLFPFKAEQIQ